MLRACLSAGLVIVLSVVLSGRVLAVSVQTISNPVPDGFMKIDGSLNDWQSLAGYAQDTIGDGSTGPLRPLDIDILQGAVAHDSNNFYFLYRCAGDNMVDTFSNWVFIDLDQNATTGLKQGTSSIPLSVGAEYNLGGLNGWNKWNADASFGGAATGLTVAAGDSNASGQNDFIEWKVSRTAVQPGGTTFNPASGSFNLLFAAEDTTTDYSPNNGDVNWFTYNASTTYNFGTPGDADGNGVVNINDYLLIQSHSFTRVLLGQNGDVDDNGFVDFGDFQQWKQNFPGGAGAAEAAIAALGVPEPTSLILFSGLFGTWLVTRRVRNQ